MLKLLYKSLVIGLISGSLLMLDFNFKTSTVQFNTVHAEKLKTEGVKDSDLMGTLTMVAVGFVASRLYTCKMTPDMMIAAAAGVAFLAGDIAAYVGLKKVLKDIETEITRKKNGELTQEQIEILKRLRESYEKAKGTAETKKKLQMAAAAAFAAAAIYAAMLYGQETTTLSTCVTALNTSATTCASMFAASCSGAGATCYYPFQTGGTSAIANAAAMVANAAKKIIPGLSSATATTAKAADTTATATRTTATTQCPAVGVAGTACEAVTVLDLTSKGYCMKPLAVNNMAIGKYMYATNLYTPIVPQNENLNFIGSFILSDAKAELFSALGIASSAALTFLMATNTSLAAEVDMFLFSPLNRAKVWAVLGMLTYAAMSATDSQIQKIQSNIDKIDAILNTMNALAKGVQTEAIAKNPKINEKNNTSAPIKLGGVDANEDINLTAQGGSGLPCVTGDNPAKCPSLSSKLSEHDLSGLSDVTQQTINGIMKTADGLNGKTTITAGTLNQAQSVGQQNNAIKKELEKSQKMLQENMNKMNIKSDLKKDIADLESRFKGIVRKELDKKKMNAGDVLASYGSSQLFDKAGSSFASDANKETTVKATNVAAVPTFSVPKMDIPNQDLEKEKLLEDKAAADEAAALAAAANGAGAGSETTMDDYLLQNDITQDKETSIFEVISNRYQKSGYPRLFKKLKN